jgi:hypothetical protein
MAISRICCSPPDRLPASVRHFWRSMGKDPVTRSMPASRTALGSV